MKSRSEVGGVAVESSPSTPGEPTGTFPGLEPFTGVRLRDPESSPTSPSPGVESLEPPQPSRWQLRAEPEVMTAMIGALVSAS